ncbi:MAG: putative molybdopterin biosynthesis protein [Pirellulaceae bacterium]|jgi:putative molybdopterin biosynthesis protein
MAKQEQFLDVIDRDEAERRFHAAIRLRPTQIEQVPLSGALGRVLSADVISEINVPSFDRSNFDGFALRAEDTYEADEENPRQLQLHAEEIGTGVGSQLEIQPGTAVAIATGGMLPRGANAILMIEYADSEGDQLQVRRPVAAGFGVSYAGTDISARETVLRRGDLLTSRETGVLAAIGTTAVDVWRRPLVGIISTGNEIIEPGEPMTPGMVYDSNAQIIRDAVAELGGEPRVLGIVQDDAERIATLVREGLEQCDVLLLSGGTSKGAGDLSYQVVRDICEPGIVAHGVALKPGKPICLAAHHEKPVVILPGFPTSAIFTFHEFVAPVLRRLAGLPAQSTSSCVARLAMKVNSQIGRKEYLLVGLVPRNDGSLAAYSMGKGSGSVTTFSKADGFIAIPRHDEIIAADEQVEVQLLGRDIGIADLVVIGSHCVGLDFLLSRLQDDGWQTKFLSVGSTAGLDAAKRGECDVAGIHLLDAKTQTYNSPFLDEDFELLPGYSRQQGLLFRCDDHRFAGHDPATIIERIKNDESCMLVNRNQGSGTRILIDQLLAGERPAGYGIQSSSHNAVAAAVVQHRADWGVAIEYVANQSGLGFVPVINEQYDFAVPIARQHRPAIQALRDLLADKEIQRQLAKLGCHVG